ncbi:shikimate kinase [Luteococcus japonicus]|uniref:Shikimate kinase n=2 Tax=Luteococcus japonicus TaxID=33984 RepID=A0A1R4JJ06_9ACTN|nr:shikimate kinase [Luteococcus japonicus]ROR53117.1 shikimate kinase [Luteococcus japonicus]SJN31998.1 Shikimate kinase I [Luteococcus japonicus LSP_Lj1]
MAELPETLVLVGAPGAGKSTIGVKLAQRLDLPFTDVDDLVAERAGMPIPEIFLSRGEAAFRELERDVTLETIGRPGVVSLGGGSVMNDQIRAALAGVHVIWLDVSAHHASRRVGITGNDRPLLAGNVHSTMVKLLNQRQPLYREVATTRVDTNGLKANAVVRLVLAELGIPAGEEN